MDAQTKLEQGTKVRIGLKLCEVVSSEYVPAHPSGYIYVHTLRHYANKRNVYGNVWKVIPVTKPRLFRPNYSFIELQ